MKQLIAGIIGMIPMLASAQLPNTQLYLVDTDTLNTSVQWLTADNPLGYNNQPALFRDNTIYYSRQLPNESETDIFSMDMLNGTITRITNTLEQEYSPKPHPDGESFTCVRVEQNGKDQHLWQFPLDRSNNGRRLYGHLDNVGYYVWLTNDSIALFLVREGGNELAILTDQSKRKRLIGTETGRTLKVNDEGDLFYVDIISNDKRYVKRFNQGDKLPHTITRIPDDCQDFDIDDKGNIYTADRSTIFRFSPGQSQKWQPLINLRDYGIDNITRILSIGDDRFIIVENKGIEE